MARAGREQLQAGVRNPGAPVIVSAGAFLWSLRAGRCDDLNGAAYRILDDNDFPILDETAKALEGRDARS